MLQALRCAIVGWRKASRSTVLCAPAVCAALSLLAGAAHAFSDDDLFFSDLPIVASVSRLPQRVEDASASVTVIDRDMIKGSGARDLNDVFRLIPGFQTFPNTTDRKSVV